MFANARYAAENENRGCACSAIRNEIPELCLSLGDSNCVLSSKPVHKGATSKTVLFVASALGRSLPSPTRNPDTEATSLGEGGPS